MKFTNKDVEITDWMVDLAADIDWELLEHLILYTKEQAENRPTEWYYDRWQLWEEVRALKLEIVRDCI